MTPRYFIHLAVANNRDNSIEQVSDRRARPVWILRGAVRTDLTSRPRRAETSVERICLARKVVIEGEVDTLTTYDHQLPDAGQARNATAVFAVPATANVKVYIDDAGPDPIDPETALIVYGRWVEDDIAIAEGRRPGRAISAQ